MINIWELGESIPPTFHSQDSINKIYSICVFTQLKSNNPDYTPKDFWKNLLNVKRGLMTLQYQSNSSQQLIATILMIQSI